MNQSSNINPPLWPLKLLRFFVKKEYLEEIEGDMEEIFQENLDRFSPRKAKRLYTFEMIKLLRPVLIKNLEVLQHLTQHAMFKNYFKVSIRGLMKNPLNSFINVFGLAAAIGICVFAYGFARYALSRDQFHTNKNEVFLVTFSANRDGAFQQYGMTPRPLGELLKQDFPQIKKVCRVEDLSVIVKYEDNVFNERVRYTDPEFLEMFTFPLKWGTISSLADVNSIILSEKMSVKYFGEENPIGQSILVKFGKDNSKAFKVTGVAKEFPVSRSFDFNFLINFENLHISEPTYDFHDWSAFVGGTLIQVEKPDDIKSIGLKMDGYKRMQNEAVKEDWAISSFGFEPLATLHLHTDNIRDDIFREGSAGNLSSIMYLVAISILMLALACFNYINIAITTAVKRLKELGVRKSIGATRGVIIIQFLTENIVVTGFALMLGVVLGWMVVIPWFERLWSFNMGFNLRDPNLWIFLPIILLITGIASGIYPAVYISKFQTVSILKGSVKFGTKNPLTKVFLGAQLVLACLFITSAVMFTQNTDYLAHRSWGYSNRDVLYAVVPDHQSYEQLRSVMEREPNVSSVSGSTHHLGKNNTTTVLHFPERDYEVDQLSVDANYFETMGLQLLSGRAFNDHEGSDKQALIVNETLVTNVLLGNAIGKVFEIDSVQYEVIGVIKDFHNYSFFKPVRPTIFKVAEKADYHFLSMKVRNGTELETHKALQENWAKLFPEDPFNGGFQEDVWGFYYQEIEIHGHVWRVFATIAILLASLGLYGLVTLNVSGRTKEFSIRKVLGASIVNIAANITRQYLVLFIVAIIIGAPLSYVAIKAILDSAYPIHMPITFWSVALASFILILVLLITISTQIRKVVKSNPVDGLKTE
jgi:putative ABC transport system permease protein